MRFSSNSLCLFIALSFVSGPIAAQVVIDNPPPPRTNRETESKTKQHSGTVAISGYLGRSRPYATWGGNGGNYLARASALRREAALYGYRSSYYGGYYPYGYYSHGYYPFGYFGYGGYGHSYSGHSRSRGFSSGSGAIHGRFSKHGSKLTVDFRFPPRSP